MPSLAEILRTVPDLEPAEVEWLHLLVEDWQLLADLAFSDLVLWLPDGAGGWVVGAHARPMTGPMVFVEDLIGSRLESPDLRSLVDEAVAGSAPTSPRRHAREMQDTLLERAVPVRRSGRTLAVLSCHTSLGQARRRSRLEECYAAIADDLLAMIAAGDWPHLGAPTGMRRGAPRVGDGVIRLDERGAVRYASPNAVSAIRRLGHQGPVEGEVLAQVISGLPRHEGYVDEGLALVTMGRAAWRADVTAGGGSASLRAIPLLTRGRRVGAIVLLRDISELRRREHELISKDQTIREIHHRVKNNLQTVAALLRLQSRRLGPGPGQDALVESVRRVGVIALVYETLSTGFSETVEFDEVAARGGRAIVDVATTTGQVHLSLTGSFGQVRPEHATSLALILSEVLQNAIEHGVPGGGEIRVDARRSIEQGQDILRVSVEDDGAGLPQGFRPSRAGLGTRIVTSMVQDLGGEIRWEDGEGGGTRVRFSARLAAPADAARS
ncbi:histidine kinase N-terminal domain-containing protein [Janibacter alkaliphilus]|uniref:histidine kinase n=1 Tax=Janibacter alkaliphilus TaxID=1069963 RepID=A0A852X9S8_9MICO|nr:two-component sensor histidine kinase [Janibacter alkaliphilus]